MFVFECIQKNGRRLGTCVDGFLFVSCCAHDDTSNEIHSSSSWDSSTSPSQPLPASPSSPYPGSSSFQSPTSYTHVPSLLDVSTSGSTLTWSDFKSSSSASSSPSSYWPTDRPSTTPYEAPITLSSATSKPPTTSPVNTTANSKQASLSASSRLPLKSSRISDRPAFDPFANPGRNSSGFTLSAENPVRDPLHTTTVTSEVIDIDLLDKNDSVPFRYVEAENEIILEEEEAGPVTTQKATTGVTKASESTTILSSGPELFTEISEETGIKDMKKKDKVTPVTPPLQSVPEKEASTEVAQPPVAALTSASLQHKNSSTLSTTTSVPSFGSTNSLASSYTQLLNETAVDDVSYVPTAVLTATAPSAVIAPSPSSSVTITSERPYVSHLGESSLVSSSPIYLTLSPDLADCGVRPLKPQARVVGGRNAYFGEWPWQVSV